MKILSSLVFCAGTALLTILHAQAQTLTPDLSLTALAASGPVEQVQYRRYGPRYGYGSRYGYGRRYGYRGGRGVGLATGLAAGAILGGAIAAGQAANAEPLYGAPAGGDAEAYCAQRFKSWDAASGTYLGFDGQRHACP